MGIEKTELFNQNKLRYKKKKPTYFQKKKIEINDYLLDYPFLKYFLEYTGAILGILFSAFTFAYGFKAFIVPVPIINASGIVTNPSLISGGASGISQIVYRIFQIFGYVGNEYTLTSICFFAINIPLFFVAWKQIGKRFTVLTLIDVILCSLFVSYIPESWIHIFEIDQDLIARALFAGVLTGLSSGVAYITGCSAGGVDVIAYTMAEKKSTTSGKFALIINVGIVLTYTIVNAIRLNNLSEVTMSLYTIIYFFTSAKIVDVINIKNKKTKLEITTSDIYLAPLLLRAFPHGCTVINATGGFTGRPRKLIIMVVSSKEVKRVIRFANKIDPNCFVNASPSNGVYGKFYIKPVK